MPKESVGAKAEIIQFEDIDWDYWKDVDDFERNVRAINGYRENQKIKNETSASKNKFRR